MASSRPSKRLERLIGLCRIGSDRHAGSVIVTRPECVFVVTVVAFDDGDDGKQQRRGNVVVGLVRDLQFELHVSGRHADASLLCRCGDQRGRRLGCSATGLL